MNKAPRVLVVSPVPSHPADQGNSARIQVLAAELMRRGVILEFFYYGMEGLTEQQRTDMQGFWAGFHFLASLPHPEPTFARHWGIDDWCPVRLCEAVRDLHVKRRFDAVLVNYVWMSRVLEGLDGTLKIIDTHDLFGDRHLVAEREGLEPRWFFTSLAEEERGFQRADLLIGIQCEETESIRRRVGVPAITVGHYIPPYFMSVFESGRSLANFGYLGSANPWNVKCVVALDAELRQESSYSWLLAGSITKRQLRLLSGPSILGIVGALTDFYRVVDCVVNPMMGGTGLKIKTVEALAFGKPVIGTRDAFQGLPTHHIAQDLPDARECAMTMAAYAADAATRFDIEKASRETYFEYMLTVSKQISSLEATIRDVEN